MCIVQCAATCAATSVLHCTVCSKLPEWRHLGLVTSGPHQWWVWPLLAGHSESHTGPLIPCTFCLFLLLIVFSPDVRLCLSDAAIGFSLVSGTPAPSTIECDTGHLCVPRQAMLIRHVAHLNELLGVSVKRPGRGTRDRQTKLPEITQ